MECQFDDYDSGIMNDYGGGNVSWWQDYIRAEVGRCNDFWRAQTENTIAELQSAITQQANDLSIVKLENKDLHELVDSLRSLLKEVVDNSKELAEDYSPNDENNHSRNCPKGLLGKYHHKDGDCICGYEAKYAKHRSLMEKLKQEGVG